MKRMCEECGKSFEIYPSKLRFRPCRFCSKACELKVRSREWKTKNNPVYSVDFKGKNNPMYGKVPYNFKPGGSRRKDGYVRIAVDGKRILLHRHLMQEHLGRTLSSREIVHHIDGDNTNNDITNLIVMSQSEHINLHRQYMRTGKVITLDDGKTKRANY